MASHRSEVSGRFWRPTADLNEYHRDSFQTLSRVLLVQSVAKRGADVRPDFNWKGTPKGMMGFRQDGAK
jgi:hypothetical protein